MLGSFRYSGALSVCCKDLVSEFPNDKIIKPNRIKPRIIASTIRILTFFLNLFWTTEIEESFGCNEKKSESAMCTTPIQAQSART